MIVLNAALLSLFLPAAALARPNTHEKLHHKRHVQDGGHHPGAAMSGVHPGGIHGGPPGLQPSESSIVPYPSGNQTQPGPTGTDVNSSSAIVTISSLIEVVPVPASSGKNGGSPTSGSARGHKESGSPGGHKIPGESSSPGDNGEECGPATVTVTSAKTVTVTVPGVSQKSSTAPKAPATPIENQPTAESHPQVAAQHQPAEYTTPKVEKPESKQSPEVNASTAQETKPKQAEKSKTLEQPKVVQKHKQPEQPEQPEGQTPKFEAEEKYEQPQQSKVQPQSKAEAAVTPQPEATKPKTQQKAQQPTQPQEPFSSPKSSPQSSPKKTSNGGKRGILYTDITNANAMANHVSWGCNWDSSPIPAIGHASGNLDFEFVPQCWGPEEVHTSIWANNSKGAKYVVAFNEPNQPKVNGGCEIFEPSDAIEPYEKIMKGNRAAGQKIVSPCVSNDAPEWLETFISGTSLKPDAVCFHWYGMNLQELQGVVKRFAAIQSSHSIPELWMTEWALNADISTNDMQELLDWLENESGVDRFAYNNLNLETTPQIKQAYCGGS